MKPIAILYATRQGQTRRIAEHIERRVGDQRHQAFALDVRDVHEPLSLAGYEGVILAASVHAGKHEPEMVDFVKRHRDDLEESRATFLSVSLAEAGAEDGTRPDGERAKASADVQHAIDAFLAETGWRPHRVVAVAGALRYSQYNFLVRFVMKRIARKASMGTDTSRDYEYTDWKALDALVDDVVADLDAHVASSNAGAARSVTP